MNKWGTNVLLRNMQLEDWPFQESFLFCIFWNQAVVRCWWMWMPIQWMFFLWNLQPGGIWLNWEGNRVGWSRRTHLSGGGSFMDYIQNFIIILLLTIAIGKRTFHLVSYSSSGQLNLRTAHGLMSIRFNIVHWLQNWWSFQYWILIDVCSDLLFA